MSHVAIPFVSEKILTADSLVRGTVAPTAWLEGKSMVRMRRKKNRIAVRAFMVRFLWFKKKQLKLRRCIWRVARGINRPKIPTVR
jgi:hypothetical protein